MKFLISTLLFSSMALYAQNASPVEQRLREQLKALTSRLNTAEAAQTALQAEKTELEAKARKLEKSFEEVTKQMNSDKEAAKVEAEKLRSDIAVKAAEVAQIKDLLVKADTFGRQADTLAKKTEVERARLAAENLVLKRIVTDQRVKNAKMLEISHEILTRYSKFGLGTALTAREPFVGITRVRLESMVDEYDSQLAAQRIRLDGTTPGSAAAPATKARPASGKSSEKKADAKP
jgi:chromosome segregation ATPase